jgi:geranylgeranyl diphosphate synthase type I
MLYGYKCFENEKEEEILESSISIELIEGFLLQHDDIIDQDEKRRGGKSSWKFFQDDHIKKGYTGNSKLYGDSCAIIAGDLGCAFANQIIARSGFSAERKVKALDKLNQIVIDVGYGEQLDVLVELRPGATEEDTLRIHHFKTAKYTVEGPVHLGAILGGAQENDLKILSEYGIPLGQAFQIQDDILGMYGDEVKLGKPADSDLKEGKQTLLIIEAMKQANESQRKILKEALGNFHDLHMMHREREEQIGGHPRDEEKFDMESQLPEL